MFAFIDVRSHGAIKPGNTRAHSLIIDVVFSSSTSFYTNFFCVQKFFPFDRKRANHQATPWWPCLPRFVMHNLLLWSLTRLREILVASPLFICHSTVVSIIFFFVFFYSGIWWWNDDQSLLASNFVVPECSFILLRKKCILDLPFPFLHISFNSRKT